jgi:hypothetical protein
MATPSLPIFTVQRKVSGRVFEQYEYCTLKQPIKVAALIREGVVIPPEDKARYAELKPRAEALKKELALEKKKKETPPPSAQAAQGEDAPK